MIWIEQVIAGIFATVAMTLSTEIAFVLIRQPYHVLRILGNMLQFKRVTSVVAFPPKGMLLLANVVHYAIGIFFTIGYFDFVVQQTSTPFIGSLLYGCAIAIIAIIGWRVFFWLHPGPPPIALRYYLPVIAIGHIVLVFAAYGLVSIYGTV